MSKIQYTNDKLIVNIEQTQYIDNPTLHKVFIIEYDKLMMVLSKKTQTKTIDGYVIKYDDTIIMPSEIEVVNTKTGNTCLFVKEASTYSTDPEERALLRKLTQGNPQLQKDILATYKSIPGETYRLIVTYQDTYTVFKDEYTISNYQSTYEDQVKDLIKRYYENTGYVLASDVIANHTIDSWGEYML